MNSRIRKIVSVLVIAIAMAIGTAAGSVDLGSASNYAVFAIDGSGSQTATFSLVTVTGNVAIASNAHLDLNAPSTINGNLYVDSLGTWSGPGSVTGSKFTGQDLSGAVSDALNAATQAAALTPDITYSAITSNTMVTGNHGMNVVKITGDINLNSASLTLSGPADAYFVVIVGGKINLVGSGGIQVGDPVPSSHVLIYMSGSGDNLLQTHVDNVIQGTLLGPNVGGTSMDGSFNSLILGRNFQLMSGAKVNYVKYTPPLPPPPVSELPTIALLVTGVFGLLFIMSRRK
jgi:hypothetical protein